MDNDEVKKRLVRDIEFLRAPEGYIRAGHPKFFTLFGRDSLIAAWQLLDYDPSIARDTLKVLSDFQGKKVDNEREEEPGKILHEWWGDVTTKIPESKPEIPWPFPYYGSIDSTFLFLIVAGLYYEKTGDKEFMISIKQNICTAVNWVRQFADPDNDLFVEFERKYPRGLFNQGWRDSSGEADEKWIHPIEIVEVQGYTYKALLGLKDILGLYGETALFDEIKRYAEKLKEAFLEKYWWEEENFFYFLFDGLERSNKIVTSNPGHLLFTGILPEKYSLAIIKRLFKDDMWTAYGIRTQSTNSRSFDVTGYQKGSLWPHDNWIIAQGARVCGYDEEYQEIKNALLKAYGELDGIPELYSVNLGGKLIPPNESNKIQAWAVGGLLNMVLKN